MTHAELAAKAATEAGYPITPKEAQALVATGLCPTSLAGYTKARLQDICDYPHILPLVRNWAKAHQQHVAQVPGSNEALAAYERMRHYAHEIKTLTHEAEW